MRPLAVLDLDGVLTDVSHRLHLISGRRKDWEAFFTAASQDPPLTEGVALLRELAADHDVVYLTGRPERTRALTEQWLAEHGLPTGPLHMRPDGDRRPARITKPEQLSALAAGATVAVVVDDDPAVVAALRSAGWPVQLATWLPHSSTLAEAQQRRGRT